MSVRAYFESFLFVVYLCALIYNVLAVCRAIKLDKKQLNRTLNDTVFHLTFFISFTIGFGIIASQNFFANPDLTGIGGLFIFIGACAYFMSSPMRELLARKV